MMSKKQKCVILKMEVGMLEELYKIFKECFPTTLISKEEFEKKLDFNDSEVIK